MRLRSGQRRGAVRPAGYRPAHAWLDYPDDGVPIRHRRSAGWRWRFRWRQLRVLLLAAVVAAIGWWQLWTSAR